MTTRSMIISSSDQVPRTTLLERFPVPRRFHTTAHSRIQRGKIWPVPAGGSRVKAFEIYRYDPEQPGNPRLDTFEVDLDDCGRWFWTPCSGLRTRSIRP